MNTKEECKYLLITINNLKSNNEISLLQYNILKELIFSYNKELYLNKTINNINKYIITYIHQLYDILYDNITLERAHILATTYVDEINERDDTRALVYGEIEFDSFSEVLKVATDNIKNLNKFVDLGHGIGRAVIVAALLTNFKEYHGIEIIRSLHETSLGVVKKFNQKINPLLSNPPSIHLTHGSFLTEPLASSWMDADLVFANSTCFPDELIADIAIKCISLPVGSRVITFTTSLRSEYFKILYKKRLFMSWGPATVFIHERMPDSEVIPGIIDRYSTSFRPSLSIPIPMPSLNISLSEIDNIDEDYDSINPIPPIRTDNSSSLATTPSGTSNWDPDTPTLKAWAKRELALSRTQLEGLSGDSSEEEDNVDTVGGRISKSNCTTSLSTKEEGEDNEISSNSSGEDIDSEEGYDLHINRLAYNTGRDGRIYPYFGGMGDSTEDDDYDNDNNNYDYNDNDDDGDDNDNYDDNDNNNESDLDDNQEEDDDLVEKYYHVDDDDDDDIEREGDSDEEIDEIYDDTS